MLFSVVFFVGYQLWRRNELRKLNLTWTLSPLYTSYKRARFRGFVIPEEFVDGLIGIDDLPVRSDDVFVCTFPKSGTTWMEEIVFLLINDLDFVKAKSAPLDRRCPFLEESAYGRSAVSECPSPRVIKSHLAYQLLPSAVRGGKCKLVYVMRNPKDVAISLHHFIKSFPYMGYIGTVHDCARSLVEGTSMYGPYCKHLQQYWEQRHRENVLIITYEQMKRDLPGSVRAVAQFLGKQLTDEEVTQVSKWCSFSEMKKNPMANFNWYKDPVTGMTSDFMRKGVVGDWKSQLAEDTSKQIDDMYDRELKPLGIKFEFENE